MKSNPLISTKKRLQPYHKSEKITLRDEVAECFQVHPSPLVGLDYRAKVWKELKKHLLQREFDGIHRMTIDGLTAM